jgi:hypothetical protein
MADIASYFSGPPLDLKNLPMGLSEEEKKKRAAGATAPSGQLPPAKPNAPIPRVAAVMAGQASSTVPGTESASRLVAGAPTKVQSGIDFRPPVQASPLMDAVNKFTEILTRSATEKEKPPTKKTKDLERLKTNRSNAMSEFARGARGE